MDLKLEIEASKNRELDSNEAALASCFPRPPELSNEAQQRVMPFVQFCEVQRVRALPAKPTSVAAFVHWQQDQGVPRQMICEILAAIESLHVAAAVGSPVTAPVVMATMGSTVEPPRSWPIEDKERFMLLPLHVQEIVARREREREVALRRSQNELADLKRQQKQVADNKEPVIETIEEKEKANG